MNKPQAQQEGLIDSRFLIIVGGVIFLIVALGYFFYGLQPTVAAEKPIELRVEEGDSFRQIAAKLSQHSLIKSISVFKLYSLVTGKASEFKPGIYDMSTTMSVPEIVNALTKGGKTTLSVTVPEGLTMKDIDRLLANSEVIKKGSIANYRITNNLVEEYPFLENMSSLEGFFFPDTYRFKLNSSPDEVVHKILSNFKDKAWPKLKNQQNWYDRLILASFLEREVKTLEDRKIVSGILLKRLDEGMSLQVDATISYAKCNKSFLGCDNIKITRSDLEIPSPYNTYSRVGWTPTPISNPGEQAITAALNPTYTQYWYYLSASDTGETIFSTTLEEHNINRSKYLK